MKRKVYLDSTIPSYLVDERNSIKEYIEVTKAWWKEERVNYELFVSEETIAELSEGDYPNKHKILELISRIQVLHFENEIIEIAQVYINNFLMPKTKKGDALHLAYASYFKLDFLLTWNCNHLANANKRQHIRIINTKLNLPTPEIVTPMELFTEVDDDN